MEKKRYVWKGGKAYRERNKAKLAAYGRKWRAANPDYFNDYYKAHKAKRIAYAKAYYVANRERIQATERAYRLRKRRRAMPRKGWKKSDGKRKPVSSLTTCVLHAAGYGARVTIPLDQVKDPETLANVAKDAGHRVRLTATTFIISGVRPATYPDDLEVTEYEDEIPEG